MLLNAVKLVLPEIFISLIIIDISSQFIVVYCCMTIGMDNIDSATGKSIIVRGIHPLIARRMPVCRTAFFCESR